MFGESAKPIVGKSIHGVCPGCKIHLRLVECTACKGLTCPRCAGKHYRKHLENAQFAKLILEQGGIVH